MSAVQDLCRKILAASFTIPDHVSPTARELLQRMLTVDPLHRITLSEVLPCSEHGSVDFTLPGPAPLLLAIERTCKYDSAMQQVHQ